MKAISLLLLSLVATTAGHGQLTVTGFDRDGQLAWTNHLCTTRPVYEVLMANSPTGTWAHLAFVTNQTSFTTTNPAPGGAAARFYRLRWADSAPLELNYEYDEGLGIGCPAAIGTLSIRFCDFPQAGTGVFHQTDCSLFEEHPEGTQQLTGVWYGVDELALVLERAFDYAVWLEGTMERSDTTSACAFTRYSGIVWMETFSGPGPIGTFVAMPAR
jgi:hypothetical protein